MVNTVTRNYHIIHMAVDDLIPFNELFIIPYLLWFFYISATVVCFIFTDREDYFKLCTFLFTGMTAFLIVSTVFPNGSHLRPNVFPRSNLFTMMVRRLYRADTGTNLFPSIHVYNSLGAYFGIRHSSYFQNRKWIRRGAGVLTISIILSTLFLKQHSVFDVFTAFIMATVMYLAVYVVNFRAFQPWSRSRTAEINRSLRRS